ncbi:hypothetical protein Tco_0206059 [Tanacetum coccineum]
MISSRISISLTMRNPNRSASYSASLLVVLNSNLSAYVYSFPSGLTTIRPAPKPLELEAPSMNSFYVEKDDVAIAVTGDYVLQKSVTATNEETNKRTANVRSKAVNIAKPHSVVVNAVRVNQENAVKASTCLGDAQAHVGNILSSDVKEN